jgi:hypothetical protein
MARSTPMIASFHDSSGKASDTQYRAERAGKTARISHDDEIMLVEEGVYATGNLAAHQVVDPRLAWLGAYIISARLP